MWGWRSSRTVVIGVAILLFVVGCVLPVASLFAGSLGPSSAASLLTLDSRQRGLLGNTTLLGLGTAFLASAIGVPLGLILARMPVRGKAAIRLLLAAPMLLPPYVVALSWIFLGAQWIYSLPAAILVLSLLYYPLSMLATEVGLRRIDGRLEEAALVVAAPGQVLRRITLPLVARHIIAAALVVFVLAISDFGVPALLRVRVYTTEVFTAFAALYDFSRATALAIPLLLLCAVVAAIAAWLLGGRLVSARRLAGSHPALFRERPRGVQLAVLLAIAGAVGLPVVILLVEASSARSVSAMLSGSLAAIGNSLTLAAVGATVVVMPALVLGYARARAGTGAGAVADVVFVILFAVPSTIVGVSLIGLWNRPGLPGAIYGTAGMLLLVYVARFLPVAVLILAAAVQHIPLSHEEAAAASGAGWLRTIGRIVVPQLQLGLAAAWIVVFVLAFGELGASVLVAPPGESTLPIRIYTMIANAPQGHIAALALLQTIVIFTPLAALGLLASLRERD